MGICLLKFLLHVFDEVHRELAYLPSVLPDTLPKRFEDAVKGLNTIGCGGLSQCCQGQGRDGADLLLLVHQSCQSKVTNMKITNSQ